MFPFNDTFMSVGYKAGIAYICPRVNELTSEIFVSCLVSLSYVKDVLFSFNDALSTEFFFTSPLLFSTSLIFINGCLPGTILFFGKHFPKTEVN